MEYLSVDGDQVQVEKATNSSSLPVLPHLELKMKSPRSTAFWFLSSLCLWLPLLPPSLQNAHCSHSRTPQLLSVMAGQQPCLCLSEPWESFEAESQSVWVIHALHWASALDCHDAKQALLASESRHLSSWNKAEIHSPIYPSILWSASEIHP